MARNSPEWLKSAVIYEVFSRNYSEAGTFDEVFNDLERIKGLGVDILWLMPIHPIGLSGRKGKYGSPYAISDYRKIAVELGNEESFKRLIERTHELGLKIMIDVVYNHTSLDSVLVMEHPEWFVKDACGEISRKFADWWDICDLDYSKKELWSYQIETLQRWADFGVDGFRCDVAPMVPLEFWVEARRAINREKEIVWLAESVQKHFIKHIRSLGFAAHSDTELHEAFDLTYDYDGYGYLEDYFKGNGELKDYLNHLFVQETLYPQNAIKMRFLENHDVQRIAAIIKGKDRLKNWSVFYSLLPGATLVFDGQEIMSDRLPNLFEKDCIDWKNGDYEFADYFKKVLGISKKIKHECSRFSVQEIGRGIVRITWEGEKNKYISIINLEDRYGEIDIDFECTGKELLTSECKTLCRNYKIEKLPSIIKV